MEHETPPPLGHLSTDPNETGEDADRREAAQRLAAMLALLPVTALLFDPSRAEAQVDGSFE